MEIEKIIKRSIDWRLTKISDHPNEAIRLCAGISDEIEGLIIDQYGPFILATIYNPNLTIFKHRILSILNDLFPAKDILIKIREEKDSNKYTYLNYKKNQIYYCNEDNSKFEIQSDPRHDHGLYLDTKTARRLVAKISKNKTILNLFSYTCAFGIVAMNGQAKAVTNIDPNKDYLEWGQRNSNLNNVIFKKYPDTTQDYLARHIRRLEAGKDKPYDITIVDPPAFLVGRGANRLARNLWPQWLDYLKEAKCKEFIIVINDKTMGRQKDLINFFEKGMGTNIKISMIDQSLDVLGQKMIEDNDPYYFNPAIFYIKR